ncbi:hypothetical protein I5O50_12185 [Serratia ureilytica]|uniref:DUF5862 family protein n=1 Tax=Serratia ureilytica TaxID=300181 RepID=UPI0018D99866|nr:hypothetical protein [Serratia ureilytica]MBH2597827.1 hypothetical protein [Serratia ureilytica]
MKVLSQYEEQYVSGGDLNAAWDGLLDGAMTGALIAGKSAGAGGFIAGAVGQLVGTIIGAVGQLVGTIIGGVAGGVGLGLYGLTHTQQEVADYAKHFRETIGSTSTSVGGSL